MKIAILGAGNIGGTLGAIWLAAGHAVQFGVRDPESSKTRAVLSQADGTSAVDVSSAIDFGEAILFSVPWRIVPEIAQENASALNGKILIDATNNFVGPVINNLIALTASAPQAKIFRAFNSLGWEVFANPVIGGQQVDMFYSGPAGAAREQTHKLIAEIGVNPVWVGDNDRIQLVDNMGALWVNMVFQRGWKRRSAFKSFSE